MDFLKDPRFSEYRASTTMKKYFPKGDIETLSAKENLIYKFIKCTEPNIQEKTIILKEKEKHKQKQRRNTIQMTNSRFLLNKTSQRLSTINSFLEKQKIFPQSPIRQILVESRTQDMRNEIMKLNQITVSIERFQKSINHSKQKVNLLKNYNSIISNHFEKFQVNEDRTRKQIVEHEEIIKLLLSKNTDDDSVAYFNAVGQKKVKQTYKGRAKSSGYKPDISLNMNSSLVLAELSSMNEYQEKCQEKVFHASQELRKNGIFGNVELRRVHTEKANIKNRTFATNDSLKESRFFRQTFRKGTENKENQPEKNNFVKLESLQSNKMKKGSITKLKQNIFNRNRNSFFSITETQSQHNQTQTDKQSIQNSQKSVQKPKRHIQKRLKTAGPLDYDESNNLIEKLSRFKCTS